MIISGEKVGVELLPASECETLNENNRGDGKGEGVLAVVISRGEIIIHLDQRGTIPLKLCCFFLIHMYIFVIYNICMYRG